MQESMLKLLDPAAMINAELSFSPNKLKSAFVVSLKKSPLISPLLSASCSNYKCSISIALNIDINVRALKQHLHDFSSASICGPNESSLSIPIMVIDFEL